MEEILKGFVTFIFYDYINNSIQSFLYKYLNFFFYLGLFSFAPFTHCVLFFLLLRLLQLQ